MKKFMLSVLQKLGNNAMNPNKFTRLFFQNLLSILGNNKWLNQACLDFQQHDPNAERYSCKMALGLHGWTNEHAQTFSAAVAEALRQTTMVFFTTDDDALKLIQSSSDNIKNNLLPKLTANVDITDPINSVKGKLETYLLQFHNDSTYFNNPYVLFGGVAATTVLAAAVAWSLTPKA